MPAAQLALDLPDMAPLDLNDEERDELVRALREVIDGDRFPLSQRVRRLKAILDKLDPPPSSIRDGQPHQKLSSAARRLLSPSRRIFKLRDRDPAPANEQDRLSEGAMTISALMRLCLAAAAISLLLPAAAVAQPSAAPYLNAAP